jgi:myo-inositol-1(or 4)-monophosphatase
MNPYQQELLAAEAIARRAGQHILREREVQLRVSLKGPRDLVTNVDRSTERLIKDLLQATFPDDAILGEEYGHHQKSDGPTRRRWLIDPIDGTQNFAHGVPLFCVSIALEVGDASVIGVIYDPCRDELFSACKGAGTWINGAIARVSECEELASSLLVTGFPTRQDQAFEITLRQFDRLTRTGQGIRRLGSAALDLAYVATGRLEAFWEYGLNPWDTGAGYLMVEEAGGEVTDVDGNAFRVSAPSILATNGCLHRPLLDVLSH